MKLFIIFQKGIFNYKFIPKEIWDASRINTKVFNENKW